MRQPVWHWIVSVWIYPKLPNSRKTLVRQTHGVAAGAMQSLKILVSVVRFRPGPPGTHSETPTYTSGRFCFRAQKVLVPGLFPASCQHMSLSRQTSSKPPAFHAVLYSFQLVICCVGFAGTRMPSLSLIPVQAPSGRFLQQSRVDDGRFLR
jgi:hypothetical protein